MSIESDIELPTDSSVSITSDGLLGDKYLSLTPGGDEEPIPDGGEIEFTPGRESISLPCSGS